MSTQDNNTPGTVPGDAQLTSAESGGNVGSSDALSLTELNSLLGRDFKDKPSALKALKDTQDFVGKRKEDIAAELVQANGSQQNASAQAPNPAMASKSDIQAVNERLFFAENPQYKGFESIIKKMGTNPEEVVGTAEFQTVFENGKVAQEVAQKKSIVSSNSRLSSNKTAVQEAVLVANATGSSQMTADVLAKAIISELEG